MTQRPINNQDRTAERSQDLRALDDWTDSEALITAAQHHFATRFPNPQRVGCPAPEVIQAAVRSGQSPGDEMREHLFRCSECFNEYREAVMGRRQLTASQPGADRHTKLTDALWRWRIPVLAAIAVSLVVVGLLWSMRPTAPQSSYNRPQPVSAIPANGERAKPDAGTDSPAQPAPATAQPLPQSQTKPAPELLAVSIDLNEYRSLGAQSRSSASKEENSIKLPAARLQVALALREQRAAGNYRISILDAADRVLATARGRSRDGKELPVTLDLRRAARQQATLRIERADQPDVAPEDYLAEITRP